MLSRIANSLFWMGRYMERLEHNTRYAHVHFYSALDAPTPDHQLLTRISVFNMLGIPYSEEQLLPEDESIYTKICIDDQNPVSLKSSIFYARENARGARDSISQELWESINTLYLYIQRQSPETIRKKGIYSITSKILNKCAVVSGHIDNSLIHGEEWAFIRLGMHIERAAQITRIVETKLNDLQLIEEKKLGKDIELYQCVNMLKSTEAYDMSRAFYRKVPLWEEAFEFLVLNQNFPKSIAYNLRHLHQVHDRLSPQKVIQKESLDFEIGKLHKDYHYLRLKDIENNQEFFLQQTLQNIYSIASKLEQQYMSY